VVRRAEAIEHVPEHGGGPVGVEGGLHGRRRLGHRALGNAARHDRVDHAELVGLGRRSRRRGRGRGRGGWLGLGDAGEPVCGASGSDASTNVKRSPAVAGPLPAAVVTVTSTVPAACAGVTAVRLLSDCTWNIWAGAPPKLALEESLEQGL